jgi:hypothetical protein
LVWSVAGQSTSRRAVNVGAPDARHFADPRCGAGGKYNDIAPAFEVIGRPHHECRRQVAERLPIGQYQGARIVELVFCALKIALPADDAGRVVV